MKKYTLIIPSENYHFSKKLYNPILSNYLKKEEFENIIYEIHKTVSSLMIKKKKKDRKHIPVKIYLIGSISIILTILFIINAGMYGEDGIAVSILLLSLIVLILLGLTFYVYFSPLKKFVTLNDLITVEIRKFMDELNVSYRNRLVFEFNSFEKNISISIIDKNFNHSVKIEEENENEGYLF
jgi:hypothetical protein